MILTAIKRIVLLFILLLPSLAYSNAYSSLTPREHLIANLLMVEASAEKSKVAAKILYETPEPNTLLLDLAAVRTDKLKSTYIDTTAWLIKSIGVSSRQRYANFLQEMKKNTDNGKLLRYLNESLEKVENADKETSFILGNYNNSAELESLTQLNTKNELPENHIDSIENGDSIDDVYRKIGYPSSTSLWQKIKQIYVGYTWGGRKNITINNAQLIYNGSGKIDLDSINGQYIVVKKIKTSSKTQTNNNTNLRGDFYINLDTNLSNADGIESQRIAKKLSKDKKYAQEYFDIAAKKIWAERLSNDPYMSDGIAHLVRYIGNGKNPRYTSFVERVIEETDNSKLRKHAKKALRSLPKETNGITQYIP